jgi:hypothetical protein
MGSIALKIDPTFKVVTAGTDGGDSLQRTYSVYLLRSLSFRALVPVPIYQELCSPETMQKLFEVDAPGTYVRFPQAHIWSRNPNNVSRDQLTPVFCYLAAESFQNNQQAREALNRLVVATVKRGMFAQNTHDQEGNKKFMPDFITPDIWAVAARGYLKSPWAPLALLTVLVGDTFSVLSSIVKVIPLTLADSSVIPSIQKPTDVDDTNINNIIMTQQSLFPTPMSWLARKIYKVLRRKNAGNTELGETDAVMGAIAYYNCNDNPGITEMSRPLVGKY